MSSLSNPNLLWSLIGILIFGIIIYALWRLTQSHIYMDAKLQSGAAELRRMNLQLEEVRNTVSQLKMYSSELGRRIEAVPDVGMDMEKLLSQRGTNITGGTPSTTGINAAPGAEMLGVLGLLQTTAHPAPPTQVAMLAPDFSEMLADYNRLSSDPRQLDTFESRWVPEAVSLEGDTIKLDSRGPLWIVRSGPTYAAVLPGGDVMRQWEKLYKPVDGMTAKGLLSTLYEIEAGTILMVQEAALARFRADQTFEVAERGKLTGV